MNLDQSGTQHMQVQLMLVMQQYVHCDYDFSIKNMLASDGTNALQEPS
eukprot:IDg13192t1